MKSYKEKRQEFSPEAQERIRAGAQQIKQEMRILRAIRDAAGLSQEELAKRLEVGQSYISRLERRENITLATLAAIAQALGGSIEITITLPECKPVKFSSVEALF
jgi:transcriptional regulator with XRE-family HTH domain